MIFSSIRWGIQAWYAVILVVVLSGFGFTAYQVAHDNQLRRVDHELEQQLLHLTRPQPLSGESRRTGERGPADKGGGSGDRRKEFWAVASAMRERFKETVQRSGVTADGQTNAFYAVLWDPEGDLTTYSTNAPPEVPRPTPVLLKAETGQDGPDYTRFRMGTPFNIQTRNRGEFREIYRYEPFGDCLLVGKSMGTDRAAMQRLAFWLLAAGSGVLALGLAGGWWVTSRAIRPLDSISGAAVKISGGNLSQRIPEVNSANELGRLVTVLNSTFARLEAAFAQQVRFTADASHELRTPVAVIISQTQSTLARERTPEEYRQTLEACQRAAQRMRNLTQSLLELARIDAGQEHFQKTACDLGPIAAESADLVAPLATERKINLERNLASAACSGDPAKLGQVVTNLLTNAIQFNREGGQVRLTSAMEEAHAVLSVSDTGVGISAEDLPHVFERFFRADKARTHGQGNSGLGLAISKAIVTAHGGTIDVQSEPGRGTTFVLRLPR